MNPGTSAEPVDRIEPLDRIQRIALPVGGVAALLCVLGFFVNRQQFFSSYLFGYMVWLGVCLGSLAIACIHRLTGGQWGFLLRRVLESSISTMPLLAVAFVPILFGLQELYPWAVPGVMEHDHHLAAKARYLNVPGFQMRALAYFITWLLLSLLMVRLSKAAGDPREDRGRIWLERIAGPGLIIYALTITFAVVDWCMSLTPHWFSSIYGPIFMGGQSLSALAFSILVAASLVRYEPWKSLATSSRWHDLGNLLFAFVMFWAYVSYMQFLIIWQANIPEEIVWYIHRFAGGWQWVGVSLIVIHFFVPFLILLFRRTKRRPERLMAVAGLLLFMRLVDLYWNIGPKFSPRQFSINWQTFLPFLAIGGFWLTWFARTLQARRLLAVAMPVEEHAHE